MGFPRGHFNVRVTSSSLKRILRYSTKSPRFFMSVLNTHPVAGPPPQEFVGVLCSVLLISGSFRLKFDNNDAAFVTSSRVLGKSHKHFTTGSASLITRPSNESSGHLGKKTVSSSQKTEQFSQEVHLKTPLSSRGLKLSNSKPGCRISALHFCAK